MDTTAPRCAPDADGFCPAHGNDCDDYRLYLAEQEQAEHTVSQDDEVEETVAVDTKTCFLCGEAGQVALTSDQADRYDAYRAGFGHPHIQDALPDVSDGEREQLLTGTHEACFDDAFGGEDE